jgi:hypothetical protein
MSDMSFTFRERPKWPISTSHAITKSTEADQERPSGSDVNEILKRVSENLIARSTGPMNFRLIIQPVVASFLAIRSGLKDARNDRPAFLWSVATDPTYRFAFLRHGWKDVGKVFLLAVVLDAIYQLLVQRGVYILELLIVVAILAVAPYLLIRGPVNRLAKGFGLLEKWQGKK